MYKTLGSILIIIFLIGGGFIGGCNYHKSTIESKASKKVKNDTTYIDTTKTTNIDQNAQDSLLRLTYAEARQRFGNIYIDTNFVDSLNIIDSLSIQDSTIFDTVLVPMLKSDTTYQEKLTDGKSFTKFDLNIKTSAYFYPVNDIDHKLTFDNIQIKNQVNVYNKFPPQDYHWIDNLYIGFGINYNGVPSFQVGYGVTGGQLRRLRWF